MAKSADSDACLIGLTNKTGEGAIRSETRGETTLLEPLIHKLAASTTTATHDDLQSGLLAVCRFLQAQVQGGRPLGQHVEVSTEKWSFENKSNKNVSKRLSHLDANTGEANAPDFETRLGLEERLERLEAAFRANESETKRKVWRAFNVLVVLFHSLPPSLCLS